MMELQVIDKREVKETQIETFNNTELKINVRTIKFEDGTIGINAEDTAKGFGFTEIKNKKEYIRWRTLNSYCNEIGFSQDLAKDDYIPESLFYMLGMKASNKTAQDFQKWLAMEVIPSIRQTGGYIPTNEEEDETEILAKAVMIAQKTIEKKDELLKAKTRELEEKNKFINQIASSQNTLLVREVAKVISSKEGGIVIGEKKLYQKLRDWKLIFKNKNEPQQQYIKQGLFELTEGVRNTSTGTFTYQTMRVTGKGQEYILNRLLREEQINSQWA